MAEEKKNRKGPIMFDINLSEEQKVTKKTMMYNTCTVLNGQPGTSKTTLCMNVALDLLFTGEVQKIYCTRPPIELTQFSKFGAVPGDAKEKNAMYMEPFLDAIKANYSSGASKQARIAKAIEKGEIVFTPLPYIRGRNLGNITEKCVVVVDEGQSCNEETMYAILTRLGEGSKMFVTMDLNQCDHKEVSGGERLISMVGKVDGLAIVNLNHNYRSGFVQQVNLHWFTQNKK